MLRKYLEEHLKENCKQDDSCAHCNEQVFKDDEHYNCIKRLTEELRAAKEELKKAMNTLNITIESEIYVLLDKTKYQNTETCYNQCPHCKRTYKVFLMESHIRNCATGSTRLYKFDSAAQRWSHLREETTMAAIFSKHY